MYQSSSAKLFDKKYLWPNGIVPINYDLIQNFKRGIPHWTLKKLKAALQEIQDHSCVKFVEEKGQDSIKFVPDDGKPWKSSSGRKGGEQIIKLEESPHLHRGNIIQEIFLAIGKFNVCYFFSIFRSFFNLQDCIILKRLKDVII